MSTYGVWGWGPPDAEPSRATLDALAPVVGSLLGFAGQPAETPCPLPELRAPRVAPPGSLAAICRDDDLDRASHALGRSYRDVVRGIRGELEFVPDLVARPTTESEVVDCLDWCAGAGLAVIPYGGGTSVVGGVEPVVTGEWKGVVSLDLSGLDRVLEVDPVSLAARIQGGVRGPSLEDQLKPHAVTLRFYPQSFERSTLGGWIATRAAGHYASGPTHIDDVVESARLVSPAGISDSRRLPASGAGPSPDRLTLGSEGTLGIVTEAWVRVQRRPVHRATTTVAFPSFTAGTSALRAITQSGLRPAAARLVDATESRLTGTLGTGEAALVLAFESPALPVDSELASAVAMCADVGGRPLESRGGAAADSWRSAFKQAPFLREQLVLLGVLAETFETSSTWERLDDLVARVITATEDATRRVCGAGTVTCRITHVYPDGAAPYFTVLAPARRGSELAQWAEVKAASSEAILAAGGTITHHHAVGRDHRPWYDRQRPDVFAAALRAAKRALDPTGMLNPGVLID